MSKRSNTPQESRLLILSDVDVINNDKTSSMAIRQIFLARLLSKNFNVTLASTFGKPAKKKVGNFTIINGVRNLNFIKNNFNVVIIGLSSNKDSVNYKFAKQNFNVFTIVDMYYAIIFEKLTTIENTKSGRNIFKHKLKVVSSIVKRGNHFICAAPRQRIYLLGVLSSLGQINPSNFKQPSISIIPTLIDTNFKKYKTLKLRGNIFDRDHKIILWLGGIYPWFDPSPLINAMPIVIKNIQNAKLIILGAKHPSTQYDHNYNEAVSQAKKTGLYNKSIVFLDWVNETQSLAYTSQADVNVILSKKSLEDEFAFRTRILTPVLLGIPTITNGQDYVSQLIAKNNAGFITSGNAKTLAIRITDILSNEQLRLRMKKNTKKVKKDLLEISDIDNLTNLIKEKSVNPHTLSPHKPTIGSKLKGILNIDNDPI